MERKWQGKPVTPEQEDKYLRQKKSIAAMYQRMKKSEPL